MTFLVATTSLPAVYRPNGYAQTTTAGTLHARANFIKAYNYNHVAAPLSYISFFSSIKQNLSSGITKIPVREGFKMWNSGFWLK